MLIESVLANGGRKDHSKRFSDRRDEYGDRPPKVILFDSLSEIELLIMEELEIAQGVPLRIRNEREWAWARPSGYLELLYHLAEWYGTYLYEMSRPRST